MSESLKEFSIAQDTYNDILKVSAEQMRDKCDMTMKECEKVSGLLD